GGVELPVITRTDRAEPTGATLTLIDAQRQTGWRVHNVLISRPQTAAGAAEDVEAGPAVDRRDGSGRLGVRPCSEVSGISRSRQRRHCGQSEQDLFHLKISFSVEVFNLTA